MKLSVPLFSRVATLICFGAFILIALAISALARPVPQNLANGLDKLVENNLIQQGKITSAPAATTTTATNTGVKRPATAKKTAAAVASTDFTAYKAAVAKEATTLAAAAVKEAATGKYMVEIMPNGRVPVATLQSSLQSTFPLLNVTATDSKYLGHGVIEGFVSLDDVPGIAQVAGVGSVILQLHPIHSVGAVTEHGVHQHRVNRVNAMYNSALPPSKNLDGTGLSIGVISDSFDQAVVNPAEPQVAFTRAAEDVASGDLPGTGNPVNSQPVVVLADFADPVNATDEGRGMCQIVHDIAPKARIAFATADAGGELGFANNIRALGGLPGYTYPDAIQQGFAGNVVCDDVSYIDEPMFQDGIVAQGVIDVVNAGKVYCSSAANNWGTDGYASVFRPVANDANATANTNINLNSVPPELRGLYAGGFHNFNPTGQNIAQTINTASDAGAFIFQWNDPYDSSAPTLIDPPIFTGSGNSQGGQAVDFGPFQFTQGHEYVITENATGTPPVDNFDAIIAIIDQNGNTIVDQDTGVDETVTFFAPATGNYTIRVHPYSTPVAQGQSVPTHGPFNIKINNATGISGITQDFNCLFFDMAGNFISALGSNAFVNNRPYELAVPTFNADGFTQVQMVIGRSNTTAPANAANQLKYVFFGNGLSGVGPAEYGDILTPVTYGHSAAAGAQSVAAYPVFRPNIPEDFTSPGPVTIYFDSNNNRLPTPLVRQKPDLAAADGSDTTFFPVGPIPLLNLGGGDSSYDSDNFPNFYGTSAASPHAAALSALLLQAHGGPGSLTPAQVKTLLQLNTFPHDLDPYVATGSATASNGGNVSVTVRSDNSRNTGTGSNDPNSFSVAYNGPGRLATLSFNPDATPQTGGNPTGGNNKSNPTGNMPQDYLNPANYAYTPGMVWTSTFLFGSSTGLVAGDVTHSYSNPAPFPSNPNPNSPTQHNWTLNFTFPGSSAGKNDFSSGKVLRFNNARSVWQDATVPQGLTTTVFVRTGDYSADMLGSGVLIPEYGDAPTINPGMTFSGTIVDRSNTYPFNGRLANKIGRGYSPLDGYGFINIEAAVSGPLPATGVVSRKTHGGAGVFDIPLPLNGPAGIECRAPGPNNSYTLVYTFDRPVANAGTVSVQGNGSPAPAPAGGTNPTIASNPNEVVVNLNGVTDRQHLIVTLSNVRDTSGNTFSPVAARMDVLFGDVDKSGRVDSNDVTSVRQQALQTITSDTCREDVDVSGRIDSNDVTVTRQQAQSLPSLP